MERSSRQGCWATGHRRLPWGPGEGLGTVGPGVVIFLSSTMTIARDYKDLLVDEASSSSWR